MSPNAVVWSDVPVPKRNTMFTFPSKYKFTNTSYYIFFVGHRPEKLSPVVSDQAGIFSSALYFFGRQGEGILNVIMLTVGKSKI